MGPVSEKLGAATSNPLLNSFFYGTNGLGGTVHNRLAKGLLFIWETSSFFIMLPFLPAFVSVSSLFPCCEKICQEGTIFKECEDGRGCRFTGRETQEKQQYSTQDDCSHGLLAKEPLSNPRFPCSDQLAQGPLTRFVFWGKKGNAQDRLLKQAA